MSQIPKLPKKKIQYALPHTLGGGSVQTFAYYDAYEIEAWHAQIFDGAVVVYGYQTFDEIDNKPSHRRWRFFQDKNADINLETASTALVIQDRPIKEEPETAEDILQDYIKSLEGSETYRDLKLLKRAKAFLEKKKP